MSSLLPLVIVIVVLYVMVKAIKIVPEGSVLKTFAFGKAHKSYGPGLHIGWFDKAVFKQVKLQIGTIAAASSDSTIEVDGHQIPAKFSDSPKIGGTVRIERFEGLDPVVTHKDVPNERLFRCEKCGHSNRVRV